MQVYSLAPEVGQGIQNKEVNAIRYFIPMKIENSTCEIAFAALGTLFLCCVRV